MLRNLCPSRVLFGGGVISGRILKELKGTVQLFENVEIDGRSFFPEIGISCADTLSGRALARGVYFATPLQGWALT